jgi:hypothetical protein
MARPQFVLDLFSGQSLTGNVCFQIASNDTSSLVFFTEVEYQQQSGSRSADGSLVAEQHLLRLLRAQRERASWRGTRAVGRTRF